MRKFAVVGVAVLGGMLALAGIAYAVTNTYTASSKITPSKAGTPSNPKPVKASLTFDVGEATGLRPSALKTYGIGLGGGVVPNTKAAKGCTSAQVGGAPATQPIVPAICLKKASKGGANVGKGSVRALVGATSDATAKQPCALTVTLINSTVAGHVWIRVDAPGPPTCPTSQHSSIDAKFVKTGTVAAKGGGKVPVWQLRFTVPPNLLHPITGLDVAVIHSDSAFDAVSKRVGRSTLAYLGTVGCPKSPAGKRVAATTFTSEAGQTVSTTSSSPCTT
jgi:hypothetical protein